MMLHPSTNCGLMVDEKSVSYAPRSTLRAAITLAASRGSSPLHMTEAIRPALHVSAARAGAEGYNAAII